ncbi:MAG: outer membrane porin GjpA, partial [Mycobacterium sp.]
AQQQEIANQVGYLQDLANGSTTFSDVIKDIQHNGTNAFNAATFLGGDQLDLNVFSNFTMDLNHGLVYLALTGQAVDLGFPAPDEPIPSIVNFLSSPLSGVLIGALGPSISPWIALNNSITDISAALNGSTPDWTTALQDFANIPANMTGAFLNGSTLDLSSLIPLINEANLIPLPEGTSLDSLSIALGGLLSPGEGTTTIAGGLDGIGGSIFNSLGLDLSGVPLFGELNVAALGIGPLGAIENLSQIIANSLGWDGTGNPLADLFGSL